MSNPLRRKLQGCVRPHAPNDALRSTESNAVAAWPDYAPESEPVTPSMPFPPGARLPQRTSLPLAFRSHQPVGVVRTQNGTSDAATDTNWLGSHRCIDIVAVHQHKFPCRRAFTRPRISSLVVDSVGLRIVCLSLPREDKAEGESSRWMRLPSF